MQIYLTLFMFCVSSSVWSTVRPKGGVGMKAKVISSRFIHNFFQDCWSQAVTSGLTWLLHRYCKTFVTEGVGYFLYWIIKIGLLIRSIVLTWPYLFVTSVIHRFFYPCW